MIGKKYYLSNEQVSLFDDLKSMKPKIRRIEGLLEAISVVFLVEKAKIEGGEEGLKKLKEIIEELSGLIQSIGEINLSEEKGIDGNESHVMTPYEGNTSEGMSDEDGRFDTIIKTMNNLITEGKEALKKGKPEIKNSVFPVDNFRKE